jgi:hypothetical protein
VFSALLRGTSDRKTQLPYLACDGEAASRWCQAANAVYEENSQLAQALIFLRTCSSITRLVAFTIGGIDVTRWLTAPDLVTCAQAALRTLAANLGQLLSNGHAAAPGATVVVTSNCDPFLAR